MTWRFDTQRPMAKHRDPIQGEFFSTESISSVADSVVRESIQNSMDAKPKDASRSVLVEFSVITIPRSKAGVLGSELTLSESSSRTPPATGPLALLLGRRVLLPTR